MKYVVRGPCHLKHDVVDMLIRSDPSREVDDGTSEVEVENLDPGTHLVILVGDDSSAVTAEQALKSDHKELSVVPCYRRFEKRFESRDSRIYATRDEYLSFLKSFRPSRAA